jgi:lipopolysaccharide transport system ATP-binding protein
MSDQTAIRVEGLWKRYGLPLPAWLRRKSIASTWALSGIDFSLKTGETLGIIGRNGAGKSTLLKVLAGVTPPTRGKVAVEGRIFPMIELNAGLHFELTGWENIRILGAIMGFSRRRLAERLDVIADFCELGEWLDQPIRKYSSGMLARLGFSVAVNMDANVLLIDEVLAVGDVAFQFKCHAKLGELRDEGKTILLVSHNLNTIRNFCTNVLYLDQGRMLMIDAPKEAIFSYRDKTALEAFGGIRKLEQSSERCTITKIEFLNGKKETQFDFSENERFTLRIHYSARESIPEPAVYIALVSFMDIHTVACGFHTHEDEVSGHCFEGEGYFDLTVPALRLVPALYFINVTVYLRGGYPLIARNLGNYHFRIVGKQRLAGIVNLDHTWEFQSPCTGHSVLEE